MDTLAKLKLKAHAKETRMPSVPEINRMLERLKIEHTFKMLNPNKPIGLRGYLLTIGSFELNTLDAEYHLKQQDYARKLIRLVDLKNSVVYQFEI